MRATELLEHKLSSATKQWIDLWSSGSNNALRVLNGSIQQDLTQTVVDRKYRLFRSWKFNDAETFEEYFGIPFEQAKRGVALTFTNNTPLSWTKSKEIAKKFFDPRYDALNAEPFTDSEISDLGYDYGDSLGVSITVLGLFDPRDILVDLDHVGGSQYEESEVIVKGGQYQATVLEAKEHTFEEPTPEPENSHDSTTLALNDEAELIEHIKTMIPEYYDESKLDTIKDSLTAQAWFYKYGPQQALIDYVKSTPLKKNSIFPISMLVNTVERMQKQLAAKGLS